MKMSKHKKVIAKGSAKSDNIKDSLLKCEVNLETGEWVRPEGCKVFYIDEDANFPDITYEIKTDESGPYEWSWVINYEGLACAQVDMKARTKPKEGSLKFVEHGRFKSDSKIWKANLNNKIIGGDLTVTVKTGSTTFLRKTFIRGKNPGSEKVHQFLDSNWTSAQDLILIKKIFLQESHYRQFYSDEMPLVSFDNGYGIGQITNPIPNYVTAWNWKEHVKTVMNIFLPDKRKKAKGYLSQHGVDSYTQEQYDTETMAYYNGAGRYFIWDDNTQKWIEDDTKICDPNSNRSWNASENKTVKELLRDKTIPKYTGHCYAKHIQESQK